jgi:hypothetical protein
MAGHNGYTTRQAAYDLRKFRGKGLVAKPGRTRRYQVSPPAARFHRRPARPAGPGHQPDPRRHPQPPPRPQTRHLDRIDRDYETLRIGMQNLFHDLGITVAAA